ncbi:metabotropic glutamate receptor-like [Tachypleus tridentatus]|uniref:metabotropic glutamate receptor-like n=1 Tax=Tachypleus tridentatus TaxID=6853 RepID=UPI003FCF6AA4
MIPPDSFQSRALSALLREFEWSAVAILTENSEYGRNGLLELQQIATRNDWTVVSVENFQTSTDSESIDVRYHLQAIKVKYLFTDL